MFVFGPMLLRSKESLTFCCMSELSQRPRQEHFICTGVVFLFSSKIFDIIASCVAVLEQKPLVGFGDAHLE